MLNAFADVLRSPQPEIQLFVMFTIVFIVIPTIGGVLILIYDFLMSGRKIPRASCIVPFIGSCIYFFNAPTKFFEQQTKKIFSLDLLKQEIVVVIDKKAALSIIEKDPGAAFIQTQMSKLIVKDYNLNKWIPFLHRYINQNRLPEYETVIESILLNANNCELFTISSRISIASLIVTVLGQEV